MDRETREPIQRGVGRLTDHYSRQPRKYTLGSILNEISTGRTTLKDVHPQAGGNSLKHATEWARYVLHEKNMPQAYKNIKAGMPAFCPAGTLDKDRQIITPTAIGVIDIDNPTDNAYILAEVTQNPHTLAAFLSPNGLKILVLFDPTPTHENHHLAWFYATETYSYISNFDNSGQEQNKLCALWHDPNIYINPDATPILWQPDEIAYREVYPQSEGEVAEEGEWADVPAEHKQAIQELEFRESDRSIGWSKTAIPCIFAKHEHDGWGCKTNAMYVKKNADGYTFHCFKPHDGHPGKKRFILTRKIRKQIRLKNVEPFTGVIETLGKARVFLKDVFNGKSLLFAIRTDPGTGKTENALTYAITHDVLMPIVGGNLRDEVVERAIKKFEIIAMGYRGLRTPSEADYLGCIQRERAFTFRLRGYNMYSEICPSCPIYLECQDRGYLSQKETARRSQLVVMPFPTVFLDPGLREFADTYMPKGEDALVIHDDLPVHAVFIECTLQTARLRRISKDWNGTPAAECAETILESITRRDWDMLSRAVLFICENEEYYHSFCQALTHARNATGKVYTAVDYPKIDAADYSTPEACHNLPHLEREDWNVLIQLKAFFDRYHRTVDMPIHVSNTEKSDGEVLTFYLPPIPYRARKTLRIGFLGATLDKQIFERLIPGIEFFDMSITEFEPGALIFQLRTNKNPRGTVFNLERRVNQSILSRTGDFYYKQVIDCIKAHPHEKHAVITYKSVITEKAEELEALGVITAHYGNLVGLDTRFDGVTHYHILFSPEVPPEAITIHAKKIYGNDDDEPLNYDRDADGFYIDERLQRCHESLVLSEIRQVIGRARLNLFPNIVYVWTSRFVDGITNREETLLFDESDWRISNNGDVELLAYTIRKREEKEAAVGKHIKTGNTKEVTKAKGVSERQAYYLTENARKVNKATENNELRSRYLDLKAQGFTTKTKIADALGISRPKLDRLLNQWQGFS